MNNLAVLFVKIIHLFVILIVISPWFTKDTFFNYMSTVLCFFMMVKWKNPESQCFFTNLEANLRGIPIEEGFIYELLRPFVKVNSTLLYHYLYIVIIITFLMALYQLIKYFDIKKYKK